jgi:antitoxin (DNA-binding transcriptional repressor) of toxin-antitoxin stability system
MAREVSIHKLCDGTAAVVAAIRAGEELTLTVHGEPVADIVPRAQHRSPWVPAAELRRIARDAPADEGLLADLCKVRGGLVGAD